MFAIEDDEWAGVSKLVEETGEVLQLLGKLMGNHGQAKHWNVASIPKELTKELGDLLAAMQFVIQKNPQYLSMEAVLKRADEKNAIFNAWWHNGRQAAARVAARQHHAKSVAKQKRRKK